MGYTDGIAHSATKLKSCMAACVAMTGAKCAGIDYSPNKPYGERCLLTQRGVSTQFSTLPGNTHFDLYQRDECRGTHRYVMRA